MINTIDTSFKEDVNILYGIKTLTSEQYVSLIKTKLDYTDDFKKILFDDTDNCLEVYEKFIKPTMDNYINDKITIYLAIERAYTNISDELFITE